MDSLTYFCIVSSTTFGFILVELVLIWPAKLARAADDKVEDRIKNAATVRKEVLDVPDNIPQSLLDKADCVVVFPSALDYFWILGFGRRSRVHNFSALPARTEHDSARGTLN
jgi:hypothetical protein